MAESKRFKLKKIAYTDGTEKLKPLGDGAHELRVYQNILVVVTPNDDAWRHMPQAGQERIKALFNKSALVVSPAPIDFFELEEVADAAQT